MFIFLIVSVVLAIGAVGLIGYSIWTLCCWPKVPATVMRYRVSRSEGGSGQKFFHPVYCFETVDGERVVSISSWGSWRRPWERGTRISVRYNPGNPRRTQVQCFASMWGMGATAAVLAVISAFVGVYG